MTVGGQPHVLLDEGRQARSAGIRLLRAACEGTFVHPPAGPAAVAFQWWSIGDDDPAASEIPAPPIRGPHSYGPARAIRRPTGLPGKHHKLGGKSGGPRFSFNPTVAGLQSRMPLIELLPERAVEGPRPGVKHEICARI